MTTKLKTIQIEPMHWYLGMIKSRVTKQSLHAIKYLDCGVMVIRVLCYAKGIVSLMSKQLAYVLQDKMEHYDATIVVWQDKAIRDFATEFYEMLPEQQKKEIKKKMLRTGQKNPVIHFGSRQGVSGIDWVTVDGASGVIECYDNDNRTVYYSVEDFDPEVFVRHGHCFVKIINRLVESDTVRLTHGAVFGYDGHGILVCGRGQMGKSTLVVQSMLQGFEYVSDDYQILECTQNGLRAYPMYSIVTLSYLAYDKMYESLRGKCLCSNCTKDKYLVDVSAYHKQFRSAYPIQFCLFPEIVKNSTPSIRICTDEEKGRAIVQLLHSTAVQMNELDNAETISKLLDMVKHLPFYKFDLGSNIVANTEYLKRFFVTLNTAEEKKIAIPTVLRDITFGLATFLDTKNYKFYTMNSFAINVYQMIISGMDEKTIREQICGYKRFNCDIVRQYDMLQNVVAEYGFDSAMISNNNGVELSYERVIKSDYKLSVYRYTEDGPRELLNT